MFSGQMVLTIEFKDVYVPFQKWNGSIILPQLPWIFIGEKKKDRYCVLKPHATQNVLRF